MNTSAHLPDEYHLKTPDFVLKPNFTPYLTIVVLMGLVIGVPAAAIAKGTWHQMTNSVLSMIVTVTLIVLALLASLEALLRILNDRVYFYDNVFISVSSRGKRVAIVRYDDITNITYDTGWTHGEVHITVHTQDEQKIKIFNTTFNHHRFGREVKQRVTEARTRRGLDTDFINEK